MLTDAQGRDIAVMVRDSSAQGFSAAALDTAPKVDEIVRVRLADGRELWGLVRWNEGALFGVEFDTGAPTR